MNSMPVLETKNINILHLCFQDGISASEQLTHVVQVHCSKSNSSTRVTKLPSELASKAVASIPSTDDISTTTSSTVNIASDSTPVVDSTNSIISNEQIHNAFLTDLPLHMGDLQSLGLSYSWPSGWITQFLEAFYITSGLPWWATIILYTLTVRIALLPTIVNMMKTQAIMIKINPSIQKCQADIADAKEKQNMPKLQEAVSNMQNLYKDNKISPLAALKGPIIQGGILISTFFALRNMATLPVPSFENGGLLWFQNLAIGDPTYVLPVISTMSVLALFRYTSQMSPSNPQTETIKKVMPVMAIGGAFLIMDFPAVLFVYWITSNLFSILQTYMLQTPALRKKFGIPKIEKQVTKKTDGPKELGFFEAFKVAYTNTVKNNMKKAEGASTSK